MVTKLLTAMESALKVICIGLLGIIVVCLFYAVVMRYLFHKPPAWSMELSRFLFLWMVIFSAVLVTREQKHIQINFVVERMPTTVRFLWSNFLRILMIGFCWVMIQQGIAIFPMVSEASTPTLGVSVGWLYLSIPVGGILLSLFILEAIIVSVVEFLRDDSSGGKKAC
jgi:TRAP-type C4-dicarboxylate transport system permease small subunit